MSKIKKYPELIKKAEKLLELSEKRFRISRQELEKSWIKMAIRLVSGLFEKLENEDEKQRYLSENNQNAECLLSLIYLSELSFIYEKVIEAENAQEERLAPRVKNIIGAPLLASQENAERNTNRGRNILFELLFLAELLNHNFKAELGEYSGNPDIKVNTNSRTYAVECKRIFSKNRFVNNFKDAQRQLVEILGDGHEYDLGIPVIDVSRVFLVKERENFLLNGTKEELNKRALDTLEKFFHKFKLRSYSPKIPALILYLSTPVVVLENQRPLPAWGHYLTICELPNPPQISLFHIIKSDFAKLTY